MASVPGRDRTEAEFALSTWPWISRTFDRVERRCAPRGGWGRAGARRRAPNAASGPVGPTPGGKT